jgi:hypothetical protein
MWRRCLIYGEGENVFIRLKDEIGQTLVTTSCGSLNKHGNGSDTPVSAYSSQSGASILDTRCNVKKELADNKDMPSP